ncbi:beta-lactamase/transpeptidase-like protein [Mycena rosella]|uniref:Beta-lactamase/transpeptidase-like protein n=1 Tax=Mycena rosella TaxID=1033263 RepID=A0AAD7DKN7_MYCRO|nr:beta-lactamase/transpeptidase-like protein [Mycena rosella]
MRSISAQLILTATLAHCASQVPILNDFREAKVITEELSSYIQGQLQANNVTGLSLGIVLPNGGVEFAAWGNRTETGDAVTPETIFHIGSCSKAFLSASLGILMQDFTDGKNTSALPDTVSEFNWDTKMRDILPDEWMVEDEWTTEKADLKDLLSHVTGLPSHDLSYSPDDSARDVVVRMRHLRAAYELRKVNEYNNQMFIVGAHIVSTYSGMSYRDFVEKRILLPLGMVSSTLHPDRAFETGRLTQSFTTSLRRVPFFMPEHVADLIAGAGVVMSTVEDMTRWIKAHLNSGVDVQSNTTIIPRSTFELATSAVSLSDSIGDGLVSISGYGLGWGRLSYRGHERVRHAGGAPGVDSIVAFYPHDGLGIVALANTMTTTSVVRDIADTVADRILGLPSISRPAANEAALDLEVPLDVPPPPMLSGFTGTYSNPGYGNFTLCSPLFPSSPQCLAVVQDFRTVDAAAGISSRPTDLFSAWPRFWGSHLRLSAVSGSQNDYTSAVSQNDYTYTMVLTKLYVEGYGADRTPFEDPAGAVTATFVEEKGQVVGLGLFVANNVSWRAKKGGSVRDIADVWFNKL